MDTKRLGEIIGASVATGALVTPEQVHSVLTDEELLQAVQERGLNLGVTAVESAQTPEPLTPEALLGTLDTALITYTGFVDTVNTARADVKGRKKLALLEAVDADTIRANVEALLSNEAVVSELQAEIDYFTANPEADSPAPDFDIVVIPEGLTAADEQALASDVQATITTKHEPYIRTVAYSDTHTPEVTGKGYRLAFAPRHYNVPKGTTENQKNWMNSNNHRAEATQLQTATDGEVLAAITGLLTEGEISTGTDSDDSRFHQSCWRRFDQATVGDDVSLVCVNGHGWLYLGWSFVRNDFPTRALVVPKA